jgi:uncharacterized membrane protein
MNKALILPIASLIALTAKQIMGIELETQQIDVITEGILAISVLIGIFTNPKKK